MRAARSPDRTQTTASRQSETERTSAETGHLPKCSLSAAQKRIRELLDLRGSLSEEARQLLPRGRLAVDVVDDLIEFPIVSVGAVGHRHDKSNQAARNAVNRLIEVGLLEPFNNAKYDRLYWNPRVFQVIQRS